VVAPLVNVIVVPLVPPAMATGALALIVGMVVGAGLPAGIATVVGLPAWSLYAAMVAVVRIGAGLPMASLELEAPWDGVAALVSLLVIVVAARRGDAWVERLRSAGRRTAPRAQATGATSNAGRARTRGQEGRKNPRAATLLRLAAAGIAVSTIGLTLALVHRPDGLARVVVLDVGQGDGILVEGGRGGRLVVDGGPDPSRLLIALDERLPPWDRRIDILILSHPHEDHVAGLALLLQRYSVGRVYEPGMLGPGPGYEAWSEVLAKGGPTRGRLQTGDRLALDSIRFRVLWPDPNRVPERPPDGGTSINNVSIVLLGEVGPQRFLLMGDVEEGVDPELLARGIPSVDLLKVAHHGSKTASTQPFLDAARPKVAVVSAGAGNPYGHPAPSTLERLRAVAGRTYRTDMDGSVVVTFTGEALRVATSGARPAPMPRTTPAPRPTTVAAAASDSPRAAAFVCGIAPSDPGAAERPVVKPPSAGEAPLPPAVTLGTRAMQRANAGIAKLGRPGDAANRPATPLTYHRPDGFGPSFSDRDGARQRSPGLLLGRRRVRARGGRRGVPSRRRALPRGSTGPLAAGGAARVRPPPR
jgi:competence protein ComEC